MTFKFRRVQSLPETIDADEILFRKTGSTIDLFFSDHLGTSRVTPRDLIALMGDTTVSAAEDLVFTIKNYNPSTTYVVLSEDGAISVAGDQITFEPTVQSGTASFTVNGEVFVVNIEALAVMRPTITEPNAESGPQPVQAMYCATSDYASNTPPEIEHHFSTDWEIATDVSFTNIVASSYNDEVNLTSWFVPD